VIVSRGVQNVGYVEHVVVGRDVEILDHIDVVECLGCLQHERVGPGPAIERVQPVIAIERVASGAAVQQVAVAIAMESVVTRPAMGVIGPGPGVDRVVPGIARRPEALSDVSEALTISRETGMAFIGPMILGILALTADDPRARNEALAEGEALLASGPRATTISSSGEARSTPASMRKIGVAQSSTATRWRPTPTRSRCPGQASSLPAGARLLPAAAAGATRR
jgi:hypothetical protein